MALKAFLCSILAATALAAPQGLNTLNAESHHVKRYEPGECKFHLHDDESNVFDPDPTHNIEMWFKDNAGNEFYHLPQTDIWDTSSSYSIMPDGFPKWLVMEELRGGADPLLGWRFKYGALTFDTNMEDHCKAGGRADPGSKGNNNRWTRDYDCWFEC